MAFHARPGALGRLLESGGDPNQAHPKTGETPLHSATGKGWNPNATECVRLLLEAGADPNAQAAVGVETDNFWRDICVVGETPLHRAAAYGDEEMIRLLIEGGADPSIKDSRGESPLTWFSRHQRDKPLIRIATKAMIHLGYGRWKETLKAYDR
jgi:ankyrin repeat protein